MCYAIRLLSFYSLYFNLTGEEKVMQYIQVSSRQYVMTGGIDSIIAIEGSLEVDIIEIGSKQLMSVSCDIWEQTQQFYVFCDIKCKHFSSGYVHI